MTKPALKQEKARITVSFGKVNLEADGDFTEITVTKFDQMITLTRAQAQSLAKCIIHKYGETEP